MIFEKKKEIRRDIAQKKKTFCATTLESLSEQILSKLENDLHFKESKRILLYYSLHDEVNTHKFIEKWCDHKEIILPVVINETDLELRVFKGKECLKKGAFGILEPQGETFENYGAIELAVIPGVAFDNNNNRLGRGKGYYDRILCNIDCYKIGICFPFQFINHIPTGPFDIKMDQIIFE